MACLAGGLLPPRLVLSNLFIIACLAEHLPTRLAMMCPILVPRMPFAVVCQWLLQALRASWPCTDSAQEGFFFVYINGVLLCYTLVRTMPQKQNKISIIRSFAFAIFSG